MEEKGRREKRFHIVPERDKFPKREKEENPESYWERVLGHFHTLALNIFKETGNIEELKDNLRLIDKKFGSILGQKEEREGLDSLTGLPNHKTTKILLEGMLELCKGRAPIAVYFIDVDDFKSYNDRYGQTEGDEGIKEIVAAHKEIHKKVGIGFLGRWGGKN